MWDLFKEQHDRVLYQLTRAVMQSVEVKILFFFVWSHQILNHLLVFILYLAIIRLPLIQQRFVQPQLVFQV